MTQTLSCCNWSMSSSSGSATRPFNPYLAPSFARRPKQEDTKNVRPRFGLGNSLNKYLKILKIVLLGEFLLALNFSANSYSISKTGLISALNDFLYQKLNIPKKIPPPLTYFKPLISIKVPRSTKSV